MKPKQRTIVNGLLALMLVIVLVVPAVAVYTAGEIKVRAVLTATTQDFNTVMNINSGLVNQTEWEIAYSMYSEVADESNNDTVIIEDNGNEYGFYNDVTTVNNTNYVLANYSLFAHSGQIDVNCHALDVTASDIVDLDFLKLTSNVDDVEVQNVGIVFWDGVDDFYGLEFIPTGNQTWVGIIDYWTYNHLLTIPDSTIYLVFEWVHLADADVSYSWILDGNELTSQAWTYDQGVVMMLASTVSIMLLGVTLALNTEMIDIKIDRKPGGST